MASLKISSIKKGYLYCKRNSSENIAVIPLCSDTLHIIDNISRCVSTTICFPSLPISTTFPNNNSENQANLGADQPDVEKGFKDA